MKPNLQNLKRGSLILSWGLYDLANQFFAMNVVSYYFVLWLTFVKKAPEILYSISFGLSIFLVAIIAPIWGTISDLTEKRRIFLVTLTLLSVIFTIALSLTKGIVLALIFFAIANFGCQMAIVFYNALMVNIAPKNKIGLVSGFGRMLGYSGAILALYSIKPILEKSGYQAAFFLTGILFLIFALPCMIFVKDKSPKTDIKLIHFFNREKTVEIFKEFKTRAFDSFNVPGLSDFLKAMFFSLCAVNIIILFMSVYAKKVFGLTDTQIIHLLSFSTIFAILGSLFSGFISDYVGYKRSLCVILILWMIAFLLGALVRDGRIYWLIGALVGTALSSTWVVSRAAAIRLVPADRIGEVFGLFYFVANLSAIVGAFYWGIILLVLSRFGDWGDRTALLSLILFMAVGFIFLLRIPKLKTKIDV